MARQAARREATRDQLFAAASALFAARGFEATTVDDIVREADVAKGTFYYHFSSKEDLVVVMARLRLGELIQAMELRLAAGVPPLDALRSFLADCVAGAEADRRMTAAFLQQSFREPPELRDGPSLPSFRRAATRAIDLAQAASEIRADVPAAELGMMVGLLFAGAEMTWLAAGADDALGPRVDRAFMIFLEGAAAR
jgi:AcrR family transcriptional regulator